MKQKPIQPMLVSFLVDCDWGRGHSLEYNLSVRRACMMNQWNTRAVLTNLWRVAPVQWPSDWDICLDSPDFTQLRGKPLSQAQGIQRFSGEIAHYLTRLRRDIAPPPCPVILFLESFSLSTLIAFALGLWRSSERDLRVWLLYRGIVDLAHSPVHAQIYKWLNMGIQRTVGKSNFQVLTDSDRLAQTYKKIFQIPVYVLPVPHTAAELPVFDPPGDGKIRCWWPGTPRTEKGLDLLQQMVSTPLIGANRFILRASSDANLQQFARPDGLTVEAVAATLSREEYLGQFARSNLLLLPYDPVAYRERTSGIFIEAVVAGKIPLVSRDTWMAYELQKYGLDPLVVDWSAADIFLHFEYLLNNPQIQSKLAHMRNQYCSEHSEKNLATKLKDLWQRHSDN
ncbi:MAG: glycosyltransferase [Caldilineaceae bacterium]|nr:glycosyltransferase [Caldilineaceae bacterium]